MVDCMLHQLSDFLGDTSVYVAHFMHHQVFRIQKQQTQDEIACN